MEIRHNSIISLKLYNGSESGDDYYIAPDVRSIAHVVWRRNGGLERRRMGSGAYTPYPVDALNNVDISGSILTTDQRLAEEIVRRVACRIAYTIGVFGITEGWQATIESAGPAVETPRGWAIPFKKIGDGVRSVSSPVRPARRPRTVTQPERPRPAEDAPGSPVTAPGAALAETPNERRRRLRTESARREVDAALERTAEALASPVTRAVTDLREASAGSSRGLDWLLGNAGVSTLVGVVNGYIVSRCDPIPSPETRAAQGDAKPIFFRSVVDVIRALGLEATPDRLAQFATDTENGLRFAVGDVWVCRGRFAGASLLRAALEHPIPRDFSTRAVYGPVGWRGESGRFDNVFDAAESAGVSPALYISAIAWHDGIPGTGGHPYFSGGRVQYSRWEPANIPRNLQPVPVPPMRDRSTRPPLSPVPVAEDDEEPAAQESAIVPDACFGWRVASVAARTTGRYVGVPLAERPSSLNHGEYHLCKRSAGAYWDVIHKPAEGGAKIVGTVERCGHGYFCLVQGESFWGLDELGVFHWALSRAANPPAPSRDPLATLDDEESHPQPREIRQPGGVMASVQSLRRG